MQKSYRINLQRIIPVRNSLFLKMCYSLTSSRKLNWTWHNCNFKYLRRCKLYIIELPPVLTSQILSRSIPSPLVTTHLSAAPRLSPPWLRYFHTQKSDHDHYHANNLLSFVIINQLSLVILILLSIYEVNLLYAHWE